MAAKTLTTVGIKALKGGPERQEIRDGGAVGLYLIVQPSGHKSFAMRFRLPDGRPTKLVLGPFNQSDEIEGEPVIGQPLTLAAARRLASDVWRQRAMGKNVSADVKADKVRRRVQRQESATNNFAAAVRDFIEGHAKPKTRGWKGTSRLLGLDPDGQVIRGGLCDRWKDRPVTEVTGHDIHAATDEARQRGIPELGAKKDGASEARARHLFSALSSMFIWLHRHRRVEVNPCASVHRPDAAIARDRVLTDAEIMKFWEAASAETKFGPLVKLLLLTGSRLNEVAGMKRSELSDDGAIWSLPGTRTKNKRPHVVPLPPLARDLVPKGDTDLIFTTTGTTPVSSWSKLKSRVDKAMGNDVPPWRLHDLRRTAATGMAEIGVAPHIVEAALNHVSGAKAGVAGTYNRAAYAPEKKAALERWAAHVERLVSGKTAKVVALRTGKPT